MFDAPDWKPRITPARHALAETILEHCQDVTTTWGQIAAIARVPEGRVVQLVADLRVIGVLIPKRQRETQGPVGRDVPIRDIIGGCPGSISGHDPEAAHRFIAIMQAEYERIRSQPCNATAKAMAGRLQGRKA